MLTIGRSLSFITLENIEVEHFKNLSMVIGLRATNLTFLIQGQCMTGDEICMAYD